MQKTAMILACSGIAAASATVLPDWACADDLPASYNLAATFDPVKQEMADGGVGNIAVIGDSLSFRTGSWLYPFIDSMDGTYGDAGAGYQAMSVWTGGGFGAGWSYSQINQDDAPYHSLDGLWATTSANTNAYLQPTDPAGNILTNQSYTLQYIMQPGGGSFSQFNYDGSQENLTSPVISTNSTTYSVGSTTFPATSNVPWYLTYGDGPVTLLGQVDSTGNPGVMISRMANGGWGINDFLQRDWTFDAQLQLLKPQLYFIWLGQNDQWETSASDYASKIEQLVDRVRADTPGAQVCLVGTYDCEDDGGGQNIPITVQGMYEAAQAEDVGFINLYDDAGNYQFFVDNNYLVDGIHFSDAGGDYMGNLMYDAFETDGASLVPEPTTACVMLPALAGLFLRRRRRGRG